MSAIYAAVPTTTVGSASNCSRLSSGASHFLGVLYQQQLLGYDPLRAGLAYLPVPVVIAAISLGLSAQLIARLGQRPSSWAGSVSSPPA